jgi:hypothetical protein
MFLPLQFKRDWYHNSMATVMNKRKILSFEGKVKVIQQKEKEKRKLTWVWNLDL